MEIPDKVGDLLNGDEEMVVLGRALLREMISDTTDCEFIISVSDVKLTMLHYDTSDKEVLAKRIEENLLKFVAWEDRSETSRKKK